MRVVRFIPLVLLLLAPLASAGPTPALHFLKDDDLGPVGPGHLSLEWPDKNESSVRLILPEALSGQVGVFAANQTYGTHLKGPLFVGIWPEAPLAQDSQIQIELMVDGDGVAKGFAPVNLDPSSAPDPTALVPPDPTNPEAVIFHIVAQAAPLILQPPTLVNLGVVDVEIPEGAEVKLAFSLVGLDGGAPNGLSVGLKYDGLLSPSYAYLPWWSPNPQASPPQAPSPAPSQPPSQPPSNPPSAPADSPAKDSPGLGLVFLLVAFAVAWTARRR